jgi:hypothetical protein
MREHEMRERIERAIRKAAVPATVGLTMALTGCSSTTPTGSASDAAVADDSGAVALYMAQMDSSPGVKYLAQMPDSGAGGAGGGAVALYMAQLPDSGPAVRYMAQQPDGGAVALYMAQMPDSG